MNNQLVAQYYERWNNVIGCQARFGLHDGKIALDKALDSYKTFLCSSILTLSDESLRTTLLEVHPYQVNNLKIESVIVDIWDRQPSSDLIFGELNKRIKNKNKFWTAECITKIIEKAVQGRRQRNKHPFPDNQTTDQLVLLIEYLAVEHSYTYWTLLPPSNDYHHCDPNDRSKMAYFIYSIASLCSRTETTIPLIHQRAMAYGHSALLAYFRKMPNQHDRQNFLNQANDPHSPLGQIYKWQYYSKDVVTAKATWTRKAIIGQQEGIEEGNGPLQRLNECAWNEMNMRPEKKKTSSTAPVNTMSSEPPAPFVAPLLSEPAYNNLLVWYREFADNLEKTDLVLDENRDQISILETKRAQRHLTKKDAEILDRLSSEQKIKEDLHQELKTFERLKYKPYYDAIRLCFADAMIGILSIASKRVPKRTSLSI